MFFNVVSNPSLGISCFCLHITQSNILSTILNDDTQNEQIVSPHGSILGSSSRPSQFKHIKASFT